MAIFNASGKNEGRENRKFVRLVTAIPVLYSQRKSGKRSKKEAGVVSQLSGGGLRFEAKSEFKVGDLIDLEIAIPHLEYPIEVVGEVVWPQKSKTNVSGYQEIGVRFRDIEAADLHRILEYVHAVGIG